MKRVGNLFSVTRKELFLIILVAMGSGIFISWIYNDSYKAPAQTSSPITGAVREKDADNPLISPLLAYNTPESASLLPLKKSVKVVVDDAISSKKATAVSVYYRDLNTSRWFGINQDETYAPASLFKVPLLITFLKDAEENPKLLSTKITNDLTQDENEKETIKALKSIESGKIYTVEELLQYMIEYSDNNATALLFKHLDQNTLHEVFTDLDLPTPTSNEDSDFISVQNYSFLFRVLYNASYLSHSMSEKGLEMLSKIDFDDGLRKGMPDGTTIADKFGEYYLLQDGQIKEHQLHDCGIVYYPKHPYLLCVMTKGDSLNNLKKILQDISHVTYQSI